MRTRKISTKSWHYRLLKKATDRSGEDIPTNLCAYFWTMVAIGTLPLLFLACIALLVGSYIVLIIDWTWWALLAPLVLVAIVAGLFILAMLIAGLIALAKLLYRRWRPPTEPTGDSTLSIVGGYVSAWKNRHCPLIEIVGDDPSGPANPELIREGWWQGDDA